MKNQKKSSSPLAEKFNDRFTRSAGMLTRLKLKKEYFSGSTERARLWLEDTRKHMKRFRFRGMVGVLVVFLIIASILFMERMGIRIGTLTHASDFLDKKECVSVEEAMHKRPTTCLILTNSKIEGAAAATKHMERILLEMKVKTETVDLADEQLPKKLSDYTTIVTVTPNLSPISERLNDLEKWVRQGGKMLVTMATDFDACSQYILRLSGAQQIGEFLVVNQLWIDKDFMLCGGQSYTITDAFDSSCFVHLDDETEVYARVGNEQGCPIIWAKDVDKGRIVVDNLGIYDKEYRGFYAASYSLLDDVGMYPVIDGAIMFLDDMPSPVPMGDSQYIYRDFRTSIADYYVNIWFPNIMDMSKKYKIALVGLVIENYEQDVDGTTPRQPETARFTYFGNQLLMSGNELGYHGYNHQPLCGPGFKFESDMDYVTWKDRKSIDKAFQELMDFTDKLYPQANFTCYVPPSNILSDMGRSYIGGLYPKVRTISGSYYPRDNGIEYIQEFDVANDGIVELPRITSDAIISDFTKISVMSELNMHMVFSHFIHPDDAMDVDRGAEIGWKELYRRLSDLCQWVRESVPPIRNAKCSELAGSIQRWAALTVDQEWTESKQEESLRIKLGNFKDEARLFLRFNKKSAPDQVKGGTLTKMTETLYLLEADQANVTLKWNR